MLYLDLGVVLTTGNVFLYIEYRIFLEAKKDVAVSRLCIYLVLYTFFNCMWKNVPGEKDYN